MGDVYVYIYDLTKGMARAMSLPLLGKQIEGVWHTGIVVFGQEWFFGGGGIQSCPPCGTIMGQPDEKKLQGRTQVSYEDYMSYLAQLSRTRFKSSDYNLLDHNCNNFSDEVSQFLTGIKIPSHITGLPQEILQTPFGQMLKPMLDQMSVIPGGGSVDFNHYKSTSQSVSPAFNVNSSPPLATQNGQSGKSFAGTEDVVGKTADELMAAMTAAEKALVAEVKEFAVTSLKQSVDWSLGRPHLYLMSGLILTPDSHDLPTRQKASHLLAWALISEEVVAMATHDPKKTLLKLAALLLDVDSEHLIPVFTNLTCHKSNQSWFLSQQSMQPVTDKSPQCLFSTLLERIVDKSMTATGLNHFASLYFNTCLGLAEKSKTPANEELVSSSSLELVTPVLEFLLQHQTPDSQEDDVKETTILRFLEALQILAKISEEAKMLSRCYGLQRRSIAQWSKEVDAAAERLFD